jgi:hypothetical protein
MEIPRKYKIKNQIWLEADMFYSEAFNCLKTSGIKTLMRCLQKRKWETGRKKKAIYTNEGFIFPYAETKALNICGDTQFCENIKKLIEVGFLDVVHQGGWYQKHEKEKDYSVYKLSERWRKYGTPEFEEVEKPKVLQESHYIRKNMERQKLKLTSLERRRQLHKSEGDRPETGNNRLHNSEVDKADNKTPESLVNSA